jgi:hypothetical protein
MDSHAGTGLGIGMIADIGGPFSILASDGPTFVEHEPSAIAFMLRSARIFGGMLTGAKRLSVPGRPLIDIANELQR